MNRHSVIDLGRNYHWATIIILLPSGGMLILGGHSQLVQYDRNFNRIKWFKSKSVDNLANY